MWLGAKPASNPKQSHNLLKKIGFFSTLVSTNVFAYGSPYAARTYIFKSAFAINDVGKRLSDNFHKKSTFIKISRYALLNKASIEKMMSTRCTLATTSDPAVDGVSSPLRAEKAEFVAAAASPEKPLVLRADNQGEAGRRVRRPGGGLKPRWRALSGWNRAVSGCTPAAVQRRACRSRPVPRRYLPT